MRRRPTPRSPRPAAYPAWPEGLPRTWAAGPFADCDRALLALRTAYSRRGLALEPDTSSPSDGGAVQIVELATGTWVLQQPPAWTVPIVLLEGPGLRWLGFADWEVCQGERTADGSLLAASPLPIENDPRDPRGTLARALGAELVAAGAYKLVPEARTGDGATDSLVQQLREARRIVVHARPEGVHIQTYLRGHASAFSTHEVWERVAKELGIALSGPDAPTPRAHLLTREGGVGSLREAALFTAFVRIVDAPRELDLARVRLWVGPVDSREHHFRDVTSTAELASLERAGHELVFQGALKATDLSLRPFGEWQLAAHLTARGPGLETTRRAGPVSVTLTRDRTDEYEPELAGRTRAALDGGHLYFDVELRFARVDVRATADRYAGWDAASERLADGLLDVGRRLAERTVPAEPTVPTERTDPAERTVPAEVLSHSIEVLSLRPSTRRILADIGVEQLGDLVSKSQRQLLGMKGFGRAALREVEASLAAHGLSLSGS